MARCSLVTVLICFCWQVVLYSKAVAQDQADSAAQPEKIPHEVEVSGRLLDAESLEPIRALRISFHGSQETRPSTITDANGLYRCNLEPHTRYDVFPGFEDAAEPRLTIHSGYIMGESSVPPPSSGWVGPILTDFAVDSLSNDLLSSYTLPDIYVQRAPTIRVAVRDEGNRPVQGVLIAHPDDVLAFTDAQGMVSFASPVFCPSALQSVRVVFPRALFYDAGWHQFDREYAEIAEGIGTPQDSWPPKPPELFFHALPGKAVDLALVWPNDPTECVLKGKVVDGHTGLPVTRCKIHVRAMTANEMSGDDPFGERAAERNPPKRGSKREGIGPPGTMAKWLRSGPGPATLYYFDLDSSAGSFELGHFQQGFTIEVRITTLVDGKEREHIQPVIMNAKMVEHKFTIK